MLGAFPDLDCSSETEQPRWEPKGMNTSSPQGLCKDQLAGAVTLQVACHSAGRWPRLSSQHSVLAAHILVLLPKAAAPFTSVPAGVAFQGLRECFRAFTWSRSNLDTSSFCFIEPSE